MNRKLIFVVLFWGPLLLVSQGNYWQQEIKYDMEIDFDVDRHQLEGRSIVTYTNNSSDTLNRAFFHLYFNAFQPNSMMDVRSRSLPDPDRRIGSRIFALTEEEQGYQKVRSVIMNGKDCAINHEGTILEVDLPEMILPGQTVRFELLFNAQVPVQIRRSGRDNKEGISYSMAQWYPKMCEYDEQGWHANPYVVREFYGIWGDYRVKIRIDRNFVVAAGGVLQNPDEVGHGYSRKGSADSISVSSRYLEWDFLAENVHDFMWAADPNYKHLIKTSTSGTQFHYFYDPATATENNWKALHEILDEVEQYANAHFGKYPYPVYSVIQGGDGGMEYPMGTLITGRRPIESLVGVTVHEFMHAWYHTVLANNESLYAWMDEGFTSYASNEIMNHLRKNKLIPGKVRDDPQLGEIKEQVHWMTSGFEEPLATHADHFSSNSASGKAAYTKGAVFLIQLKHIVGKDCFDRAFKRYFNEWKFKHPTPNDFLRIFEKESGLELDWYKEYMMYTLKTIDYGIDTIVESEIGKVELTLSNNSNMPMPQDISIELRSGKKIYYTIPLRIMRGSKGLDVFEFDVLKDWPWTHPKYTIDIPYGIDEIVAIELDPMVRTTDVNRENNIWLKE